MTTKHQYYRNGVEISEAEATDHRGLLRDRTTMRVGLTMRDSSPSLWAQADPRGGSFGSTGFGSSGQRGDQPGDLCSIDGRPGRLKQVGGELRCVPDTKDSIGFTDHSGDPWSASRPGFRVRANDDRRAVHDAYQVYATRLVNQYKLHDGEALCATCNGSGVGDDGGMCDDCMGEGVVDDGSYQRSPDEANTETNHDSRRTLDAAGMTRHRQLMDRLYREHDTELANMWRSK